MPKRHLESEFIERFKAEVYRQHRNAFCYKIPDAFQTGLKPFDVILDTGVVRYLEFKWVDNNRLSFRPIDLFRPHQIRTLSLIQESKAYPCCYGVIQHKSKVFLIETRDFQKECIRFDELDVYTLKQAVSLLCQNP